MFFRQSKALQLYHLQSFKDSILYHYRRKKQQNRNNTKNSIFSCYYLTMKDIILQIKSKAIALDIDSSLEELENQLIDLKMQIKILDDYLDLKMVKD